MIKLEFMKLSIGGIVIRFYMIMAVVIIGGFSGNWWLAVLALPIFLSAMLGVKFSLKRTNAEKTQSVKTKSTISKAKAV